MAKDDRLYGKFTQDFADNPKILPLSDSAFRCLVEATLYSRRMLTDGFLATRLATAKWPLDALHELASNDPLKPSLSEVDGGWLIHDYAEHQDTKAEVEARRSRNVINGRKGGEARAKQVASQSLSKGSSQTQAETETETETSTSNEVLKRPASRGSRLSPEWMPSAASVATAKTDAPDIDCQAEHSTFVDYWIAQPGQKGVKTNWESTWRNWMRRKQADLKSRPTRQTPEQRARATLALATDIDMKGISA
ncbi:MAG: hypothetical protein H7288_11625 [Kineosporiaceae bacterium]|nr:hypothetical protein [Aeromicrobium sp.]